MFQNTVYNQIMKTRWF